MVPSSWGIWVPERELSSGDLEPFAETTLAAAPSPSWGMVTWCRQGWMMTSEHLLPGSWDHLECSLQREMLEPSPTLLLLTNIWPVGSCSWDRVTSPCSDALSARYGCSPCSLFALCTRSGWSGAGPGLVPRFTQNPSSALCGPERTPH